MIPGPRGLRRYRRRGSFTHHSKTSKHEEIILIYMIQLEAKVGSRGQTVIPKPIRDQMGIHPGDQVYFRIEEGQIVVEKVDPEELLEAFLGAYEKRDLPEDPDWDREHGAQYEARFDRARRQEE